MDPEGPRLVLLDFGLAKKLPPDFRRSVTEFGAALLQDDPEQMAKSFLDLGFETRDGSSESLVEIARALLDAARELREQPALGRDTIERMRHELPDMIRANPIVRIPSHVVLLGRVLGLLSGTGHALGARVDLMGTIVPYLLGTAGPQGAARP